MSGLPQKPPTKYGEHGMEGMVTVTRVKSRTTAEQLETQHLEEAYFSQHRSVLVLDILPKLQLHMERYLKELKDYNTSLKTKGSPLRVRARQCVTGRGQTYHYWGRYVYERKKAQTLQAPEFTELSEKDYNSLTPPKKAQYTKSLNAFQAKGGKLIAASDINDSEEKPPRDRWLYVGKMDDLLRDRDYKHLFDEIGTPPFNPLEGLKIVKVLSKGVKTNHIIIPVTALTTQHLLSIFDGYTYYALRGA